MRALNRAFERALDHSDKRDNIAELLSCIGDELRCDRICVFEVNDENKCAKTYEWTHRSLEGDRIFWQNLSEAVFNAWYERLQKHEIITVLDTDELKAYDPDVYRVFTEQGIHRAVVSGLSFHGKAFGFFVLENPSDDAFADRELLIPGLRYVLSSMVYSEHLVRRLMRIGYKDSLTGAGNRLALQEHLSNIEAKKSLSIIYCDVIGWRNGQNKQHHLEIEQTVFRTAQLLLEAFGEGHVFRTAVSELLVVMEQESEAVYEEELLRIKVLLREHNLLVAIASLWKSKVDKPVDTLLHSVHQVLLPKRRMLAAHRDPETRTVEPEGGHEDFAQIDMIRGNEFFKKADVFLSELFEESVATIVFDINHFKLYNDIFGRKAGNTYLENLARTVVVIAEKFGGICGYTGGDTFCAILPSEKKDYRDFVTEADTIYGMLDSPEGFATVLGIYFSSDRRESVTSMYDRALGALHDIKGEFLRGYHFYSKETYDHQKEDQMVILDVKDGLRNNEFVFYVQPQVLVSNSKIIGGEALVRWNHKGKLIPPVKFIPILEKTGYIYQIDCNVWENVAKWLHDVKERGIDPVPISVNVSRVDFYFADIAEHFINLVEKYELSPSLIGIEITESALTDNMNTILEAIKRMREYGFHVLMDDFGSGSSSLSMLHTMDVDVLKTDMQFLAGNDDHDERGMNLVRTIVTMAKSLGMTVVSEGVETAWQKDMLVDMDCNYAQGYYFYRPMPVQEFEKLIADKSNVELGGKSIKAIMATKEAKRKQEK